MRFRDRLRYLFSNRYPQTGTAPGQIEITGGQRFHAAENTNFTADWTTTLTIDPRPDELREMQKRSRTAEKDIGYMRKFLGEVESNVIGKDGIRFEAKCRTFDSRATKSGGITNKLDARACTIIDQAWTDQSKKKNWTANRRYSRRRYEQALIRRVARDGGALSQNVFGHDNDFRFAVHPIRITHLDPTFRDDEQNIYMGIEFDEWDTRVAYHVSAVKRKGQEPSRWNGHQRFEANQMRHIFLADDPDQAQGVPWASAAILRLRHLGEYEEAHIIAAREFANNTEYFEQGDDAAWTGEEDAEGNLLNPSAPGDKKILPRGMKAQSRNPSAPNSNYPDFRTAMLKGMGELIVPYHILGQDLSDVNFSSIRAGTLSERDQWRLIQSWFIDDFEGPTFEDWLRQFLLVSDQYSIADFDRLNSVEFSGREWGWVDPKKDVETAAAEVELGINSRERLVKAGTTGSDFATVTAENKANKEALEEAGLPTELGGAPKAQPVEIQE